MMHDMGATVGQPWAATACWPGMRALVQCGGGPALRWVWRLAVVSPGGRGVLAGPAGFWGAFGLAAVGAGREAEGPLEGLAEGELAGISGPERDLRQPQTGAAQGGGSPGEPDPGDVAFW